MADFECGFCQCPFAEDQESLYLSASSTDENFVIVNAFAIREARAPVAYKFELSWRI
jgi:hypothetical protein